MYKMTSFIMFFLFTALLPYTVSAATVNGNLGATSTATTDVTLVIGDYLRISDLDEIAFGTYAGSGHLNGNDDVCLYYSGSGDYRVTITDDSNDITTNAFQVENIPNTEEIDMDVYWNDKTGTSSRKLVTYGAPLTKQSGANNQSNTCSVGGLSANLSVSLRQADLQAVSGGYFASELTILVEPD